MEWYSAAALVGLAAVNVLAVAALGLLPDDLVVPLVGGAIVALVAVAGAGVALRRRSTAERLAVALGALAWWRPRPPVEHRRATGAAWHGAPAGRGAGPRLRGPAPGGRGVGLAGPKRGNLGGTTWDGSRARSRSSRGRRRGSGARSPSCWRGKAPRSWSPTSTPKGPRSS